MATEVSENQLPTDQSISTDIDNDKENYRHEYAAKEKARRFVGRIRLRDTLTQFCASPTVENNTLVVTGEPGDGKTSLLAYASAKCMEIVRKQGDFVFTHIVDCCPGSNSLQNMLKRLHQNLSPYAKEENPFKATTDLRTVHVVRLEEIAKKNPNKTFVIIIDAVNQFSTSMQSHSMWWLPSRKAPTNLRVVISTLSRTGDTFENACKRCPEAIIVEMPNEMLEDDCKEMVLAMLKQHNMTITTDDKDDPRVGNQMQKLLNKRKSPLYLKTAVEGLRTKWIMATGVPLSEAYTIYIENLPLTAEELFEKLLDSWEGDFGQELIRWLMTIISLSRDGLREAMLIDLLAYVEGRHCIKFGHSVRNVLDYIRGFLSSESIEYIRFFHEEISQVALYRYKRRNFVPEVHDMIVQFFLKHIKLEISNEYDKRSLYYDDCLSQVVYHQTEIRMFAQDCNQTIPQVSTYNETLCNIFFIKERIALDQEMELLRDFRDTANINMDEDERSAISEKESFTKAQLFVGRTHLRDTILQFCTSPIVESNIMVLTGEPGAGKTSILAYVSSKCMENLPDLGGFFFHHVVDSYPGSHILKNMLKRLHGTLSKHIGEENPLKTTTDLKALHVARLEEVAKKYPSRKFVIIIDAVNRFSTSMQSHSMWWLPSRKTPTNLRVVISTLSCTGDTFENALKRCPKALIVEMPNEMLEDDCKEMVLAMLKRLNIEFTIDNNDPRVGNQIQMLLDKKKSPLYLKAAVEGLRTKWIMATEVPLSEAYTIYIENLPLTAEELFEILLDSWEGDFGHKLIRWLMTIISLSRDGVKKSMLTDLMAHIERSHHTRFKHSIQTVLDYIRSFLSSERLDYIRFFHEGIPLVALLRYDRRNFVAEVHDMIVQFCLKHIRVEMSGKWNRKCLYYDDCLSQVVYHQTEIRMFAQDWARTIPQVSTYNNTLRNIFFIKARIGLNEEMELLSDFRDTADINMTEDERSAISDWERFTHFHWRHIKQFPQWAYAFALNQPKDNAVAKDTRTLLSSDVSEIDETFPLKWLNKPNEVDQIGKTSRCVGEECFSSCVATADQNLLAFGCDLKSFICNQTTAEVLHQVRVGGSAHAVHFSSGGALLWVGDNNGYISIWDTCTGQQEFEELEVGNGCVLMIANVNDRTVVCGTGTNKTDLKDHTIGTITVIDTTPTCLIERTWSTKHPCWSYCYKACEGLVFSGHDQMIISWNIDNGSIVKCFKVSDSRTFILPVRDMCVHNNLPIILYVTDTEFAGEIRTLNTTTNECNTIVRESGRRAAQFDHTGDCILCTSVNGKTISIFDLSGVRLGMVRIHGGRVNDISALPYPCSFVSAGDDGGKLHIASTTPVVENTTQIVTWCALLPNNKEFVTLSEVGEVCVYDVSSLELCGSVVVKISTVGWRAAVHSSCEFVLVCTWNEICVVDLYTLNIVYICRPPDQYITIRCVQFTPSGDKCIILTAHDGTYVYKVHNKRLFEHLLTFTLMKNGMWWCDVTERLCVIGGEPGILLWDINTGKTLHVLRAEHICRYVKFIDYQPFSILYHTLEDEEKRDRICIMRINGHNTTVFDTKVDHLEPKLLICDNYLITAESDGTLRLHNMSSGEIMYVFVDELSLGFTAFFVNPVTGTINCYNGNSKCYAFEKTFV